MKQAKWNTLTPRQRHVLLLAMQVRNAMEEFHVTHLSDAQMAELNPIIRQALNDIVTIIEEKPDTSEGRAYASYLVDQIPDYWELPTEIKRVGQATDASYGLRSASQLGSTEIQDLPKAGVPQLKAVSGHSRTRTCWSQGCGVL